MEFATWALPCEVVGRKDRAVPGHDVYDPPADPEDVSFEEALWGI